jgi:2-haloacid dehalogenase
MGDYTNFWHVTGDALDYAMATHGLSDVRLRAQLMDVYLSLNAFSEVKQTLETLRERGYQTAILSNGSPEMLVSATRSAGIYSLFDALLNVDTVGVFKPDARVYRLATEHFDVRPDQVAFQSSNGWDIAGASYFGFKTIWINRYKKQRETLPHGPAAEVSSLDAMLDMLPTNPA